MRKKKNPNDDLDFVSVHHKQNIRIALSRVEFMTTMPRFYRAYDYVEMKSSESEECPTIGISRIFDSTNQFTGYHQMFWNPHFLSGLTDKQLLGVQMHELLHILLGHTTNRDQTFELESATIKDGYRRLDSNHPKFKDDQAKQTIWNYATDLSINCLIKDYLKPTVFETVGSFEGGLFPGEGDFITLPPYKTAEFYYQELLKNYKNQMRDLDKFLKDFKEQFEKEKIGSHSRWDIASKSSTQKDDISVADIEKDLKDIADDIGLTSSGKQAGTGSKTTKAVDLSAGKERKIPGWMKKTTHESVHGFEVAPVHTRKVPDRRYGLLFPGRKRISHRNKCLVAVDVSGSINRSLLNIFTEHLSRLKKYADFDLVFFNESIINPTTGAPYEPHQGEKGICQWKTGMKFYIGGGTRFEPLMIFWNRIRVKYDSFFIMTDGEASYKTPPSRNREVNWLLYGTDTNVHHGNKYDLTEKIH